MKNSLTNYSFERLQNIPGIRPETFSDVYILGGKALLYVKIETGFKQYSFSLENELPGLIINKLNDQFIKVIIAQSEGIITHNIPGLEWLFSWNHAIYGIIVGANRPNSAKKGHSKSGALLSIEQIWPSRADFGAVKLCHDQVSNASIYISTYIDHLVMVMIYPEFNQLMCFSPIGDIIHNVPCTYLNISHDMLWIYSPISEEAKPKRIMLDWVNNDECELAFYEWIKQRNDEMIVVKDDESIDIIRAKPVEASSGSSRGNGLDTGLFVCVKCDKYIEHGNTFARLLSCGHNLHLGCFNAREDMMCPLGHLSPNAEMVEYA